MSDEEDGDTIIADDLSEDGGDNNPHSATNNNNNTITSPEITSGEMQERQYAKRRYHTWMIMLIISTFVCSILITCVKFFAPNNRIKTTNPRVDIFGSDNGNGMNSIVNQRRLEDTLDYLVTKDVSDIMTLLPNNTMSPQYLAARWIATIDKHQLDIPKVDGSTSKDEYPFVQRYSLAVLFLSIGGLNWRFPLNFLSGTHECAWFSVFSSPELPPDQGYLRGLWCDKDVNLIERHQDDNLWTDAIVTNIDLLPDNGAYGRLPTELRHLRYLKSIQIYNSLISGEIPSDYGYLKDLKYLDLEGNRLQGRIPESFKFLENMVQLNLRNNYLTGTTQEHFDPINQMDKLKFLALDSNEFGSGNIPEFNLPELGVLTLSDNDFSGAVGDKLSKLNKLEYLGLDNNDLTGRLDFLQDMKQLTHVYLDNNNFGHILDDDFMVDHENITHLDISNCSIHGSVPAHFFDFTKLEVLDLSRNLLDGELPNNPVLSPFTKLWYLSLHSNNIEGQIPEGITYLKSLKHLDLSVNNLTGPIIDELGKLTSLEYLFLGNNDFEPMRVPEWIRNLTNIEELSLKGNNLYGEIPDWIGELDQLTLLDLGSNSLNDTLPDSMGNLTKLWILILNSNNLSGNIPSSFRQIKDLEVMIIDDNNFKGNADPVCQGRGIDRITHFVSDCASNSAAITNSTPGSIGGWDDPVISGSAEILCECCTLCCMDEDTTCNDDEWIGHHEGQWQSGYDRVYWNFEENGIISEITDFYDTLNSIWGDP